MKDCYKTDGSFVEGEEPDGKGLSDVDVEEGKALVEDCMSKKWLVIELIGQRFCMLTRRENNSPADSTSISILGLKILYLAHC